MQFKYSDLGYQDRGNVVEVTLSGSAVNVRLMDSSNFESYRSGRAHHYYGGLVRRSPVRLIIPSSNRWYVTIDFQGLAGETRFGIRGIPAAALATLPDYAPPAPRSLSEIVRPGSNANDLAEEAAPVYDVFISHATEDKEDIVRPLANALVAQGLRVWYDEFELRIGDSLRRKVDAGLAQSRFGVVVLSHAFFSKNWPQYELDGLVTREMSGQQVILPLWHRITKGELMSRSPSLADKVARSTADLTVDEIAAEIAGIIRSRR